MKKWPWYLLLLVGLLGAYVSSELMSVFTAGLTGDIVAGALLLFMFLVLIGVSKAVIAFLANVKSGRFY